MWIELNDKKEEETQLLQLSQIAVIEPVGESTICMKLSCSCTVWFKGVAYDDLKSYLKSPSEPIKEFDVTDLSIHPYT